MHENIMSFSEKIKYKVKKLSHLSCCICKSTGIEVHHIIPQNEGGEDSIGNAAPLCPSCHELYGANPQKRKFIRESRDIWFEICQKRYHSDSDRFHELQNDIKELSLRIDIEKIGSSISEKLYNMLLESPFIIKNLDEKDWWTIDEVLEYLLKYKIPTEEKEKINYQVTFTILFENEGDPDDPESIDYVQTREEFIKTFGNIMAQKLTLNLIHFKNIDWNVGVSEEEICKLIFLNLFTMLVLIRHEDLKPKDISLKIKFDKNGMLLVFVQNVLAK